MKTKSIATLIAIFDAENGRNPTDIMTSAAITRPTVRNFLASERSESVPIMNLLNAYAMETADAAIPTPCLSMSPSAIMSAEARERFLRTR